MSARNSGKIHPQPKLRLALLLDSFIVPNWVYGMMEQIVEGDFAEVALCVISRPEPEQSLTGRFSTLGNFARKLDNLGYHFFQKRQQRFRSTITFGPRNLRRLLGDKLNVTPICSKQYRSFPDSALKEIRKQRIDVAIHLGLGNLTGKILSTPRYGVWAYHHGDNRRYRGGPSCFWEVMEGYPVTGATLYVLGEKLNKGKVLARCSTRVSEHQVEETKAQLYGLASNLLPRALRRLQRQGAEPFFRETESLYGNDRASHHVDRTPGNLQLAWLLMVQWMTLVKNLFRSRLFMDQWLLLYSRQPTRRTQISPRDFRELIPPRDRFWADPFVITRGNASYLFFEEFFYSKGRGHISCVILEDGRVSGAVPVLSEPHHLSYPHVFFHEGSYYMIPESHEARTVDLYHCIEFPYHWEKQRCLLQDVKAADSTIFRHGGHWWLFVAMATGHCSLDNELYLFFSDNLLTGTWKPHPKNPVIRDVHCARPAGELFWEGGRLYRPSQDCSQQYGYGLRLQEVERLTPTEYQEREAYFFEPLWKNGLVGTHTLNQAGEVTVMDACWRRLKPWKYVLWGSRALEAEASRRSGPSPRCD